jgi:hypothetical protein
MKRQCIRCDKEIKVEEKTGVLIGGLELVAYAQHGSKYDMGKGSVDNKTALLCICDECFKSQLATIYKFGHIRNNEFVNYGDEI